MRCSLWFPAPPCWLVGDLGPGMTLPWALPLPRRVGEETLGICIGCLGRQPDRHMGQEVRVPEGSIKVGRRPR